LVIFKVSVKKRSVCKVNHCRGQIVLRFLELVFIFGAMKKIIQYLLIAAFFIPATAKAQFETARDSVVQLYGVIMTADSLVGIPAVSIVVKGQNRGTITNNQGVFSIVVLKGDEVEFTHISYKPKTITIPRTLEGTQYSVIQLMVNDTVYLPATIIRQRPTAEQFARDFVNTKVPDDNIEIARKNTDAATRRALMQTVPGDGGEATRIQLNKIANRAVYQGQIPPMNIFNPAAWADFIQAWKRGDFKNKH
jgi:CarboxypepD_reg-like domain